MSLGLAAKAVFRSFTVRSVLLAALVLTAINLYAGKEAHATICDPLEPCARSVLAYVGAGWADPTDPNCAIAVQSQQNPYAAFGNGDTSSTDWWCQADITVGVAGSLIEGAAVSPGLCATQVATSEEAGATTGVSSPVTIGASLPTIDPTPLIAEAEAAAGHAVATASADTATVVACATSSGSRQGRSYYRPKGRYAACDGKYCQNSNSGWVAGDLAYRLDNYTDEYHCGGWQDADCSSDVIVRDSRNRQYGAEDPRFQTGGGGQGEFGGSWDARKGPLRPYCQQNFNVATLWCSSYWYDR